jgi:hypothetical protein
MWLCWIQHGREKAGLMLTLDVAVGRAEGGEKT